MMWDGGWGVSALGMWVAMAFAVFFGLMVLVGLVLIVVWAARAAGGRDEGRGGDRGWDERGGPRNQRDWTVGSAPGGWDERGGGGQAGGVEQACDAARMRYARGEISREEYEEICRVVRG